MKTESELVNIWIEGAVQKTQIGATQDNLILVLNCKFPEQLSPEVQETIQQQPNLTLLRSWLMEVIESNTFEEFVSMLRR